MQKRGTSSAFEHVLEKYSLVETLLEGLGTKQDRVGKTAARNYSINILVAREITKERTCLLGRKTRKLLTDVAKEVVKTIFTSLIRIK